MSDLYTMNTKKDSVLSEEIASLVNNVDQRKKKAFFGRCCSFFFYSLVFFFFLLSSSSKIELFKYKKLHVRSFMRSTRKFIHLFIYIAIEKANLDTRHSRVLIEDLNQSLSSCELRTILLNNMRKYIHQ